MPLSRDSRQIRKWKAFRRKQFQFEQECRRIDFEEDVLIPEIESMLAGRAVGHRAAVQGGAWRGAAGSGHESMLTRFTPVAAVLALALLLSPLIARNLQAMHERAAYPYFFPTPQRLLTRLAELTAAHGAATVMADQDLSVSIPAYVANANIVAHRVPTTRPNSSRHAS